MTSAVRQNYHQDCEAAVNRQINMELYASYVYLSMVRPGGTTCLWWDLGGVYLSVVRPRGTDPWTPVSPIPMTSCVPFLYNLVKRRQAYSLTVLLFHLIYVCFFLQSYYFDRDDVALRNFAKFFRNQSHEEREHAEKLMKLQNERGGRIFLQDVRVWQPGHFHLFCFDVFLKFDL